MREITRRGHRQLRSVRILPEAYSQRQTSFVADYNYRS